VADVVRLAIVYETQQAASRLNGLNRQLGMTGGSTKKMASAAIGLAQAMSTGSISATALTNRMAALGGKLGTVGLALAVVAGVLLLIKKNSDAARAQTEKFADQLRQTKRAVDDLFRAGFKSQFRGELEQINDEILLLDRQLNKQRMNLFQRLFGGFKLPNIKRFLFGGSDPETLHQRGELGAQAGRLTPEAERQHVSDVAAFDQRTARNFARLMQGSAIDMMSNSLDRARKELEDLVAAGLDPMSEQAKQMAASILQGEAALRKMTRASNLLRNGLETIASALEDFVVTATLSFSQLIDNILRLLIRDFTGSIIDSIMRGVNRIPTGGTGGSAGIVGADAAGGGITGSLNTNINFTVNAIDAQGVAQFISQNGPQIAAVVAGQADRSRAIRRKFLRG
jgi:hypothetical protein